MRAGLLAVVVAFAALAIACGDDGDEPREQGTPVETQTALAIRFVFDDPPAVRWQDVGSEEGYAVTGLVMYGAMCEFLDEVEQPVEEIPLDEELPPGTTELPLPEPSDERVSFLQTIEARVEALGVEGVADELAYSADPGCE